MSASPALNMSADITTADGAEVRSKTGTRRSPKQHLDAIRAANNFSGRAIN